MQQFQHLLLQVWREACRHIELIESARNIAHMLARRLPLESLEILQLSAQSRAIEVSAQGPDEPGLALPQVIECSAAEYRAASSALKARAVLLLPADERWPAWIENVISRLRLSAAEADRSDLGKRAAHDGDAVLVPLVPQEGPPAAMLLRTQPNRHFSDKHFAMLKALVEPLSVAVDNDHRLRELQQLREAAEAEKRSLLARLGRKVLLDAVVGSDSGLRQVMERVELVAGSDAQVMILGETGSGKEVVARAIHSRSKRVDHSFIRVNCGAIPSELVDSELFGHEKGAFTGAVATRQGWFERANGGTLFLDEVGELPLAAQVRLLRVLQDGVIERVGGNEPIKVDVRIVSATHRDLAKMVADGRFREDLWYRLNVFPILLPPLRDRVDDIPDLARHFAERAATRFGLPACEPTASDIELLSRYAWPGNVRELAAVIDRAAILGMGKRLEIARALGEPMSHAAAPVQSAEPQAAAGSAPSAPTTSSELHSLEDAMRVHIERALQQTGGRVEGRFGAARLLDINPNTLRSRMRKLGINGRAFQQE